MTLLASPNHLGYCSSHSTIHCGVHVNAIDVFLDCHFSCLHLWSDRNHQRRQLRKYLDFVKTNI
jgi:hypothetical protein